MTRVLVVEDNEADVVLLERALSRLRGAPEVELVRARSLAEGRERLAEGSFSAVLLDLGLPDGQGAGLVTELLEGHEDLPLWVLSGLADPAAEREALERGARGYLLKGALEPALLLRVLGR